METILVTGASRGIGLELTRRYLQANREVLATCRNPDKAENLNELSRLGNISVYKLDVTNEESIRELAKKLANKKIDILINNAGILEGNQHELGSMNYSLWQEVFNTNTIAPYRIIEAFLDNLKLSQNPRIISISSQMGSLNRKTSGHVCYRSSKAALNKVMQVIAEELRASNIIACPVHPGWVKTDMGGENAEITLEQSVTGLFKLIDRLTIEDTGRFWTWQGEEHVW